MEVNQQTKSNKEFSFTLKQIIFLIFVICVGIVTTFVSGFYTNLLLHPTTQIAAIKPTPTGFTDNSHDPNEEPAFVAGKQFYEDTAIFITEEAPHTTLVVSASRYEQDKGYIQNTRASYFDGTNWEREIKSQSNIGSEISTNSLLEKWSIVLNPSKVLRQQANGKLNIGGSKIEFVTNTLENEIGVRSLPGYTKFMSEGQGILTVEGSQYNAKVLYTRIYSYNSSEIFFYGGDEGIKTDWLAVWDLNGNFYHIDSTEVSAPIPNYSTHSIGIYKSSKGEVSKTFNLEINRDASNPPVKYIMRLSSPINAVLTFDKLNHLNKAPDNTYIWDMGLVKGVVEIENSTSEIYGVSEFISK